MSIIDLLKQKLWRRRRPSDKKILEEMRSLERKYRAILALENAMNEAINKNRQEMELEEWLDIILGNMAQELCPKYGLSRQEFLELYMRLKDEEMKKSKP